MGAEQLGCVPRLCWTRQYKLLPKDGAENSWHQSNASPKELSLLQKTPGQGLWPPAREEGHLCAQGHAMPSLPSHVWVPPVAVTVKAQMAQTLPVMVFVWGPRSAPNLSVGRMGCRKGDRVAFVAPALAGSQWSRCLWVPVLPTPDRVPQKDTEGRAGSVTELVLTHEEFWIQSQTLPCPA